MPDSYGLTLFNEIEKEVRSVYKSLYDRGFVTNSTECVSFLVLMHPREFKYLSAKQWETLDDERITMSMLLNDFVDPSEIVIICTNLVHERCGIQYTRDLVEYDWRSVSEPFYYSPNIKSLRNLALKVRHNNAGVVYVNQVREKYEEGLKEWASYWGEENWRELIPYRNS